MGNTFRRDEGATAIIVAVCLTVFIGLSALVVDMGYWYNVRRQLQTAADSAALAGCQDLILDKSDAEIWDTVGDLAHSNESGPVSSCDVIPPSAGGLSDITENSVKVTVTMQAQSFFGRLLGIDSNLISAQSRAQVGYLAGAKTPVPWALPILNVTRMTASVGGGPEVDMYQNAGGEWEVDLPAGSRGEVTVIAYNDQTLDPNFPEGVPEIMTPVADLFELPAGSRFEDIRVPDPTTTSEWGESVSVYVDLTAPLAESESIVVTVGKKDYTASQLTPTSYMAQFAPPETDDLYETTPLDVAIVIGKTLVEEVKDAAILISRRSTYPFYDVTTSNTVYRSGEVGLAHVEVTTNDYAYGQSYELKVIGGAGETGNFMAIDFHTLRHTPYWRNPQDPAEYPELPGGTVEYYDYVAGTSDYDFVVHIGDTVWTEPGNMSGPQTRAALLTRFGGEAADFDAWVAAGKPGSRRLIYVPITEKVQLATGTSPLRVVSFAMFYVEEVMNTPSGAAVRGRFVEYSAPSWSVTDSPPDDTYVIETAHLVAEGLDF